MNDSLPFLVLHFKSMLVVLQVENSPVSGFGCLKEAIVVLYQKLNVKVSSTANLGFDVQSFFRTDVLVPTIVHNQVRIVPCRLGKVG